MIMRRQTASATLKDWDRFRNQHPPVLAHEVKVDAIKDMSKVAISKGTVYGRPALFITRGSFDDVTDIYDLLRRALGRKHKITDLESAEVGKMKFRKGFSAIWLTDAKKLLAGEVVLLSHGDREDVVVAVITDSGASIAYPFATTISKAISKQLRLTALKEIGCRTDVPAELAQACKSA